MQGEKPVVPGWVIALVIALMSGGASALAVWFLSERATKGG